MNEIAYVVETIIKAVFVLAVISALAGFATYVERKVLGLMHRRLGPMHVGPYGLLQVLADGIKLFMKEDVIPQNVIKPIFLLAPIISVVTAFLALAAVPLLPEFTIFDYTVHPIISDVSVGVLFVLAVSSSGLYAPLFAGLSSSSKYSLIGGARASIQLLSFEVVTSLSILAPLMLVSSLSLIDINDYQSGGFFSWLVFKQPVAFILFIIAGFAETNRVPMDLLEAETEIISGYATEYSGLRWGYFFIGEYSNMITISFLVSLIFLGGYNSFWIIPGGVMIILKVMLFMFFFIWVRGAWPHIRPDQLMSFCWKILMPIALLNIFVTGLVLL